MLREEGTSVWQVSTQKNTENSIELRVVESLKKTFFLCFLDYLDYMDQRCGVLSMDSRHRGFWRLYIFFTEGTATTAFVASHSLPSCGVMKHS